VSGNGVTVLGSLNMDLALHLQALPAAGETVLSRQRVDGPGGKGLNQAVAAARAGAFTRMIGAVGEDAEGMALRRVLAEDRIDPLVRATTGRTGLAVVLLDAAGENSIVVAPGTNAALTDLQPAELAAIADSSVLLMQLEVPLETVAAAARSARDAGAVVVLNAAPAVAAASLPLDSVDLLVVNEGEARILAGDADPDIEVVVDKLLELVPAVVVTLGPAGALYRDAEGSRHRSPGLSVEVVDTTGAGDTFAGYLAAALSDDVYVSTALDRANAAAALCVQRRGAVPAVPHRRDVDIALAR
jgi:ribokinase